MFRDDVKTQSLTYLLERLGELARAGSHFFLVVVGDGATRERLLALAERELPGRYLFLGLLPRDELGAVFGAGDVFAFPGIGESLGMVYLEAQAAGLPVVALDDGGVAEVVRHGETGLLVPRDDDTAFCQALAGLLDDKLRRRAMTNGMNVANALLEAEGVELLMTGGHLRRQSQSFYGDQAEQSLQNYHFDLLFLGVDAIDLDRGVSTHNEDEARLNRKMCEVAERIIVVTDSSKFNRSSLHKIIDTQRIDMIIVDEGIPAESLEGLRKSGVEVVLVKG